MTDDYTPTLPADINAEQAVLGSCLLDRDAVLFIQQWFRSEYFYLEKHSWVWEAILASTLRGVPPDPTTVADELRRRERFELIGGYLFLQDLIDLTPTAVHVEYYARIVERTATLRRLIEAGGQISCLGYDQRGDIEDIFSQARAALDKLEQERTRSHPRVGRVCDLMQEQLPAIEWIIPGLISQGFGYLAAAPGAGKTWMLLQWALAISSGGYVFGHIKVNSGPVLFLALEDTKASLQERIRMLGHERIPDIFYYSTMEAGWAPLDDGGLHQLENAILATRPALVVIDTLTSVSPNSKPGGNPYRAEYQSYIPVRELAEEYGCAIIGAWHFAKGSRNSVMEQTSGTMGLPAVSVNRIGLVREPDSSDARIKSHSKRGKEADWALSFDMTTGQWAYQGETKEHQTKSNRDLILQVVEEQGQVSFKEMLEATGIDHNNLLKQIQRMVDEKHLIRVSRGVYAKHSGQQHMDDTQHDMT
jgi:hypothetical protein